MARTLRIRHKLMLGMGLIVAIMALLLGGTVKGLTDYKTTLTALEAKINELEEVDNLRSAVKALGEPLNTSDPPKDIKERRIPPAREALEKYHTKLKATAERRHNPHYGFRELNQVEALKTTFDELDQALAPFLKPGVYPSSHILQEGPVRQAIAKLVTTTDDLSDAIYKGLNDTIITSVRGRREFNWALGFIITTTIGAGLIMIGLLRFFYRGVVRPIGELAAGAQRVAKGDFEHPIQLQSGDEMEDFARTFNDMTSRLQDMYRDLAQQVNERSRQLVRSERLAGVGFLAAGVAHEINNPLASIAFCGEALESRLDDFRNQLSQQGRDTDAAELFGHLRNNWEIIAKYLKMIQDEAFRCKEITSKLLAFSRGGERRREPSNLVEVVQSVLDMVQHLQNCKGKELIYEPREEITAWINSQEIKQVFLNLVVNAVESMEEGGRLTITQAVKDGQAEIVFKDSGCGMSQEILENIFEPFFTRSRTGKGTGLGLSISHRIVSQHGGEIEAASAGPNHGSTFLVRLPLGEPATQTDPGGEDPDPETEFLKLSTARQQRRAA